MVKTLVVLFAVLAFIAGCTSQAQREALTIQTTARETLETLKVCIRPIETKPEYARLYEKIAAATTSDLHRLPSQAQLADAERPSDTDIALALTWYAEGQQCALPAIEALIKVVPEVEIPIADEQAEAADLINEVVTTRPTFGHINQRLYAFRLHQKEASARLAQNVRARLVSEHEQELQERQALAEGVAELAVDTLLILATRQANLAHAQLAFAKAHPTYRVVPIRTISCNPGIKSAVSQGAAAAKAQIIQGYAARGQSTDPRQNTMLAQELMAANNQALIASVSAGCQF
jgi:hypothetical protein